MLEGVQILIDRMESNPEDFVRQPRYYTLGDDAPRFMHIADALESVLAGDGGRDPFMHLTAEEKAALLVAYRKMARQAFTANIIAQVFGDEEKRKRVLVTKRQASLTTTAPVKAEGADVGYYAPNGEPMINPWDDRNRTGAIGDKLRAAISKYPR
jgi:hypothetical protein